MAVTERPQTWELGLDSVGAFKIILGQSLGTYMSNYGKLDVEVGGGNVSSAS